MTSPTDDRADHEANLPGVRVNDEDREAAIDRIQQAMVDGYVEFDELDDRFGLVYAAGTRADLDRATAGIPAEVVAHPIVGHPTPSTAISLIGDLIRGGWMAVSGRLRAIAIIGSVKIDLTTAEIPHDGVVIDVYSLIGDVQILVPDGAGSSRTASRSSEGRGWISAGRCRTATRSLFAPTHSSATSG